MVGICSGFGRPKLATEATGAADEEEEGGDALEDAGEDERGAEGGPLPPLPLVVDKEEAAGLAEAAALDGVLGFVEVRRRGW